MIPFHDDLFESQTMSFSLCRVLGGDLLRTMKPKEAGNASHWSRLWWISSRDRRERARISDNLLSSFCHLRVTDSRNSLVVERPVTKVRRRGEIAADTEIWPLQCIDPRQLFCSSLSFLLQFFHLLIFLLVILLAFFLIFLLILFGFVFILALLFLLRLLPLLLPLFSCLFLLFVLGNYFCFFFFKLFILLFLL